MEGINLTPTLMFDYPTVPDLVEYIWSQVDMRGMTRVETVTKEKHLKQSKRNGDL